LLLKSNQITKTGVEALSACISKLSCISSLFIDFSTHKLNQNLKVFNLTANNKMHCFSQPSLKFIFDSRIINNGSRYRKTSEDTLAASELETS